jgi:hypothetical protein
VPFSILFSFDARDRNPGGGEWARSEQLYAGPHL